MLPCPSSSRPPSGHVVARRTPRQGNADGDSAKDFVEPLGLLRWPSLWPSLWLVCGRSSQSARQPLDGLLSLLHSVCPKAMGG